MIDLPEEKQIRYQVRCNGAICSELLNTDIDCYRLILNRKYSSWVIEKLEYINSESVRISVVDMLMPA